MLDKIKKITKAISDLIIKKVPVKEIATKALAISREEISNQLAKKNLTFYEQDSRINWGLIGHIKKENKTIITIFEATFYVGDDMFPLNEGHLKLIKDIQTEYAELSRDEHNNIVLAVEGVGHLHKNN